MKKRFIYFTFLSFFVFSASAEDIESHYKKHYIQQMKPIMTERLSNALPKESKKQIEIQANSLVIAMANCQFKSVQHYPKEYWGKAILPIANGENIFTSNENFELYMSSQLEQGKISNEEIVEMVEKAQNYIQSCLGA